jgi:hypothetical protein
MRRPISSDGLFLDGGPHLARLSSPENRPIDSDSCRSRADFESRNFSFEIKSEEI